MLQPTNEYISSYAPFSGHFDNGTRRKIVCVSVISFYALIGETSCSSALMQAPTVTFRLARWLVSVPCGLHFWLILYVHGVTLIYKPFRLGYK